MGNVEKKCWNNSWIQSSLNNTFTLSKPSLTCFFFLYLNVDDGALSLEEFKAFFSDGILSSEDLEKLFQDIDTHKTK